MSEHDEWMESMGGGAGHGGGDKESYSDEWRWKHRLVEGRAQMGYTAPYAAAIGQQFVFVDLPQEEARTWTVHMSAMKFQGRNSTNGTMPARNINGGVASVNQGGATQFARNQNNAGSFGGIQYTPGAIDNDSSAQAQCWLDVTFGVGGGVETVRVDYPWAGGTFEVSGATVKIVLVGGVQPAANNTPVVSVFIVPKERPSPTPQHASLTVDFATTQPVTSGGSYQLQIPRRAVRYTIAAQDSTNTTGDTIGTVRANIIDVVQTDTVNVGASIFRIDTAAAAPFGSQPTYQNWSGGEWTFPIHPLATSLIVSQENASSDGQFSVRFDLDLG